MGLLRTNWNESALNTAKQYALFNPGGNSSVAEPLLTPRNLRQGRGGPNVFFSETVFLGSLTVFVTAPLVELHNVDVSLSGQRVLTGITWSLMPGQHWAVLGGNGSGKSTFLKLVRGELWPAPGVGTRAYRLGGAEQRTAVGIKEEMPLVSPETQDRYLQIDWTHRVREVIYSGFAGTDYLFRKPTVTQRAVADEIIELLGVDHLLRRNVQGLSTGELRRVLIARALVRRPKVLLLDEVCDGLDAPARGILLGALESVARAGVQLIYTTHREEELVASITHVLVLKQGRIAFQAARTSESGTAAPHFRTLPRIQRRISRANARKPLLIRIDRASVYLNRARVLRDVTWQMRDGENWAVLGPNGSGKTTFLRLVCGDVHPAIGSRVQRFEFTSRDTLWDLRRRIGFVSPALQATYREPLTGRQLVASGYFSSVGLRDRVTQRQWRRVDELMSAFGVDRLAAVPIQTMSYGEFRKLMLLRALVHEPAVLVCDEPFDGLDVDAKRSFSTALDELASNGTRLITVTHHIDELPASTTHALVLENGRIVCQGELENVRAYRVTRRLFG
jgi:molybdate transport system ATP-binding protein